MPQNIVLSTPLTPAQAITLTADIASAHVIIDPLKTSLTESQEKGLLTVSTEKESTIKDIALMADTYPELLPVGETVVTLAAKRQEALDCESFGLAYGVLSSIFLQRAKLLRNDVMFICTETLDSGKLKGKNNTGIKTKVNEIKADHYKHGAKAKPSSLTINAASQMVVPGVTTGKVCVNTGHTILSFLVVNGSATLTITLNPASSFKVPLGWTNMVVTNLNATEAGSFDVYMS